jgi:hypothetical protein
MCKELKEIEAKFKEISRIDEMLDTFPLLENGANYQTTTDKSKSADFGEVFTPLWLVDKMILKCAENPVAAGKKIVAG